MNLSDEAADWNCAACGGALEIVKVGFTYLKGNFEVDLPACSACGSVGVCAGQSPWLVVRPI